MIEDIVLESPAAAASVLVPPTEPSRRIDHEFTLHPRFASYTLHFRMINGCFIEIEKRDKKDNVLLQTCFHVGLLEPEPKTTCSTAWMTFLGALLTGIAAGVIAYVLQDWLLVISTALLSASLFAVHYCSYRKQTEFISRSGKVPLISLSHRCRCRSSLNQFIDRLKESIEKNTLPASSYYFAEETRWHRMLKEQGWIGEDDYQKARARIMKQFNRKVS
jgi:hypothetical protein